MEVQKELNSLTSYFFDDIEEKDVKRMEREECLKIKEEKEYDEIKKRREEELQKMQGDYPFSYGSLIGNKKVTSGNNNSHSIDHYKEVGERNSSAR